MVIRAVTVFVAVGWLVALCCVTTVAEEPFEIRRRTPAMIGDFFGGSPLRFQADRTFGSLTVLANDLDVPMVLPGASSPLTLNEAGPVGIFATQFQSIRDYQALLRAGSPLPPATLVGTINDNAVMTSSISVSQIQTLFSSTAQPFDIVPIQAPPATYTDGVQIALAAIHGPGGRAIFNSSNSGAVEQGGLDSLSGGEDFDALYFFDYVVRFDTGLVDAASGGVGRTKIAEGGTVIPQDRVFMRYNYVDAVNYMDGRGLGLNRFTPGFERAFLDGLASFELRAPFASRTVSTSTFDGVSGFTNDRDVRFGNLTLYGKLLLIERERTAISGGLGIALPTAQDIRVQNLNGTPLMEVANEAVRLQPFLGALLTPSERWYAHGFAQFDAAASGNLVSLDTTGHGLQGVGRLTDANQFYLSSGVGYWLYRDNSISFLTSQRPLSCIILWPCKRAMSFERERIKSAISTALLALRT